VHPPILFFFGGGAHGGHVRPRPESKMLCDGVNNAYEQVGNQHGESVLRSIGSFQQILPCCFLWSLFTKYFDEAVLHPLGCCAPPPEGGIAPVSYDDWSSLLVPLLCCELASTPRFQSIRPALQPAAQKSRLPFDPGFQVSIFGVRSNLFTRSSGVGARPFPV